MALLPWDDEEEKQKDPFALTPVQSVQSGWQPTQANDDKQSSQPENYLFSDQKAQVDQQLADQRAAEEAQKAEAARVAAETENARRAQAANELAQQQKQAPATKYTNPEKKDEGLVGFIKNIGAGLQQGVAAVGDVAIQGGGVLGYLGERARGIDDATASQNMVRNSKKLRDWLQSGKDITGQNFVGTRDVEEQATRISNGQGTLQDYVALGGKSLQIGLDSTMFLNPGRALVGRVPATQAAVQSTNLIRRAVDSPAVRYAARDAAFYGGLQGAATTGQQYGQDGDIAEALKAGATDAIIGGAVQGGLDLGGSATRKGYQTLIPVANKTMGSLRNRFKIGDEMVELAEQAPVGGERQSPTAAPVEVPTQDGNISFENPQQTPQQPTPVTQSSQFLDNAELTPVRPEGEGSVANQLTPEVAQPTPQVADGVVQTPEPTPSPVDQVNLDAVTPEVAPAPQVADGTVQSGAPVPVPEPNAPTIRSEEIRNLQEARVGKSQADEAAINERLQEFENQVPRVMRDDDTNIDEFNRQASARRRVGELIGKKGRNNNYTPVSGEFLIPSVRSESVTFDNSPSSGLDRSGKYKVSEADARSQLREAGYSTDEIKVILDDTRRSSRNKNSHEVERLEASVARFDAGYDKRFNQTRSESFDRAGVKQTDDYSTALEKIDNAVDDGRITPDEAGKMEDELFTAENQKGRAMAEDGKGELPDEMQKPVGEVTPVDPKAAFAKRFMTSSDGSKSARQQLANSVGLDKDGASDISTILTDAGIDGKTAQRITDIHNRMEEIAKRSKGSQKANQKDFVAGKEVNQDRTRAMSREIRELGVLQRKFNSEINRLKRAGAKNAAEKATQAFQNISSGRLANMLSGAGLIERNITQELLANAISTVKNPIKTTRGAFNHGSNVKSAVKSSADGWKDTPKTASEAYQYVTGNLYKSAMTGADAAARARAGGFRTEMTQWAYKELMKQDISAAQAEKLSRTAGNVTESMVNMLRGVDNGMVSNTQAMRALKAWKNYMRTGKAADLTKLEALVSKQETLADAMVRGFNFKEGSKAGRFLSTMVNSIFPFMRTAYNLTNTGVTRTLNPFAKSLLDDIRADQRSGGKNVALILKNKLVDYGLIGGAVALVQSGVIQYNDGDDVDKPRGISIKIGDNEYISIRATPIELPLAVAATIGQIVKDTAAGKTREPKYYAGMLSGSLPYIDQLESNTGLIDSVLNLGGKDDDGGYALKQYGVNLAKSHVPGSNNGLQAYLERWKGNSLNAKKVYDEDPMQWLYNSVMSSYDPKFRDSLEDSRDAAGRVRTVDNQGSFIRKDINDPSTAFFNDDINDLVAYARENDLGNGTAEMFNTYDTGKNNNFKSIQDSITFLDVEDGGKPDNTKKLEQSAKLTDLSRQIRDGFYGDTGSELLTLDGQNLKSDASAPNTTGSKNSKMPISMQSIKNAVAQTDLGKEANDQVYQIGLQKGELYNQFKAKSMSYDQYAAAKSELEKTEVGILSGSKNYQKMVNLMDELSESGFFDADGMGSTKSGQTFLWNSLNALLGSKGATPAANYPDSSKGFTPFGRRGTGRSANAGGKTEGTDGIKWTPVKARQMANVQSKGYTPVNIKVKLGNAVKKDKSQNYSDRTI